MTAPDIPGAVPPVQPAICLVEDEPVLRKEMGFQLSHHGFEVHGFGSADELDAYLDGTTRAATVVLDIGLGDGEDGLTICQRLRRQDAQRGIVFVTARSLRDERLAGLTAGADAYLVKPVDMDELVLVLHRLAQRGAPRTPAAPEPVPPRAQPRPWTLDIEGLALVSPEGLRVALTLAEFQLMRAAARKPGQPCNTAELCRALDLQMEDWNQHRVEVILSRLRKKVERQTGTGLPVRNLRGEGYVWVGHDDLRTPRGTAAPDRPVSG